MTGLNRDPPHVLVISGETETDRDYEIEHPPECPLICDWWPGARGERRHWYDDGGEGRHACVIQYELEAVGLDGLSGTVDGVVYDEWREIPPGRYLIEGWSYWSGSAFDDADSGIDLTGYA